MDLNIEEPDAEELDEIGIPNLIFKGTLKITGVPKVTLAEGFDMEATVKKAFASALSGLHEDFRPVFKNLSVSWE